MSVVPQIVSEILFGIYFDDKLAVFNRERDFRYVLSYQVIIKK